MRKCIIILSLFFLSYTYAKPYVFQQKDHLLFTVKKVNNLYKSGNVYQGITKWRDIWIVTQTDKNKKIIFSFLNSQGEVFYHQMISYPSHGQDLSVLPDLKDKDIFYLVTTSKENHGVAFFKVNMQNKIKIKLFLDRKISMGFNTPMVSNDGHYILVKNYNRIYIYKTNDILKHKKSTPIYSFFIHRKQQKKGQSFQGIAMCKGLIFCISGNNKLSSNKYLFVYDAYGKTVKNFKLNTGKEYANLKSGKWELEGLHCDGDTLFTSVMSGKDGNNTKQFYEILEVK